MSATENIEEVLDEIVDNLEYDTGFPEFMANIEDSVKNMVKESANAPKDAWESFAAFKSAVDWNESFIKYLISFHIVLLLLTLIFRKNVNIQTFIFFLICILIYIAERLNTECAFHWKEFATQNYFDKSGAFAGMMFAGPLLTIGFIQLINFLFLASDALITSKRLEIKVNKLHNDKITNNNINIDDDNVNNSSNRQEVVLDEDITSDIKSDTRSSIRNKKDKIKDN